MVRLGLTIIALATILSMIPMTIKAKRSGNGEDRRVFVGVINSMPSAGLHGEWLIGDLAFSTVPQTEFDQTDGPLTVKGCAKVEFRNGVVHEVDSEPLSDCR